MPTVKPEPRIDVAKLHPDQLILGLRNIAIVAGLLDEHGRPDVDRAGYLLKNGYLPGFSVGKTKASTLRLLSDPSKYQPVKKVSAE